MKLSVVMGLGWVLGFAAAFIAWSWLWYVFIIVNSLQGAMLCVAFVATRQVKRLLADCLRPLRRRAVSGTGVTSSNQLSSAILTPGTEMLRLSLPEVI